MASEITRQLILIKPTQGVMFGLQKGSGCNYETVRKQIPAPNDLSFRFTVTLKGDRSKNKYRKFSGSFVQDPAANRFVFIGTRWAKLWDCKAVCRLV